MNKKEIVALLKKKIDEHKSKSTEKHSGALTQLAISDFEAGRARGLEDALSIVGMLTEEKKEIKKEPKWLYRLESINPENGLWYNSNAEFCFNEGIGSLDDSCKTKNLPMGYDKRYRQDGRMWFSSCSRKEDLTHWFSKEDAKKLIEKGFVFTKYLATEYVEYEFETVFIKDTSLERVEISLYEVFDDFPHFPSFCILNRQKYKLEIKEYDGDFKGWWSIGYFDENKKMPPEIHISVGTTGFLVCMTPTKQETIHDFNEKMEGVQKYQKDLLFFG